MNSLAKQKKPSILEHVILNPVSYIHRQRLQLPISFSNPRQQAVINRILLKRYALNVEKVEINQLNKPTQWIVQYWYQLRQITFLMACQRSRAALARGGLLLKLPNWARQFALLPLRDSSAQKSSIHLSTEKILALGLTELLSWEAHLPPWLMQRLLLLLPSESEEFIQNITHSNSSSKVEREGKQAETRHYSQYGEEPHSEADKVIRMKWDSNQHAITPDLNLFLLAAQHAKNHYDPNFANIA